MKQLFSSAFLSLIAIAQLSAQKKYTTTYQVDYGVTYSLDSLHLDQKDTDDLYLYTGTNFSVFTNYDVIAREKALVNLKKKFGADASLDVNFYNGSSNSSFNKTFYKDMQTGKVTTVAKIGDKEYIFEEPKRFTAWQVKDSTKIVKDYTVQKATTHFAGRDYVAWFTLEVPINDGPYLFSGLPGLIVELYDTKNDYHFKLKSLEKLKKPKIWTVSENAKIVTKAEFKKSRKKVAENVLLSSDLRYMMSHTPGVSGIFGTDEKGRVIQADFKVNGKKITKGELKRRYKKILESQNNPIELK